jgi:hypothetical protein
VLEDLAIGARPEVEVDQLGGAPDEPPADILTSDDQVLAAIVHPAHQHMAVRMAGVEVVDRHPVELRAEILFDLAHPASHQQLEVLIFRAILGCDDEAELVPVAGPAFEECLAVGNVA